MNIWHQTWTKNKVIGNITNSDKNNGGIVIKSQISDEYSQYKILQNIISLYNNIDKDESLQTN